MFYKTVSLAYRTDSTSLRDVLFELSTTAKDKRIVFKSEVFHYFCKKGFCDYVINGYTDNGITFITLRGPIIKSFDIDYAIYPNDNEYGVDAEIERIFFQNKIIYSKPKKENAEAILLF